MHIHVHHGFILGEGGGQGGAFAIPWQTFTPLEIHVVSDLLYTKVYVASSPLEFFNSFFTPLYKILNAPLYMYMYIYNVYTHADKNMYRLSTSRIT